MRWWPLSLLFAACSADPPVVVVSLADDAPPGLALAADDLVADLSRLGATVERRPTVGCLEKEVRIVIESLEDQRPSSLQQQGYRIIDERCGDGRLITLRGEALLPAQWAVYDLLQRLGVRYFHPEQTYYPPRLVWPESVAADERPWYAQRSFSVHRTHPVELSAPLDATELDMASYQKRWIDWNVKLRTTMVNGWDQEYVGDYAYLRGFPRVAGLNLLNAQQGGRPVLDPDDPRPESEQLTAAIQSAMAPSPGTPEVSRFGFQFNPSEFTEADDQATVNRLTFIADYFRSNHPQVRLYTINHGTAGQPTPHYGIRFFDLPQLAPINLGVQVHTLMFYDLERPAPVYGNQDFKGLLAWIRQESPKRRITYYPEGSWWLTFDLPVPLYLAPVTLEARQHDLNLLSDLVVDATAPAGVDGHHLFSSGQEWGYWLIDYCTAKMIWAPTFRYQDCVAELTGILTNGPEIQRIWQDVERRQIHDLRDPELLRFLVGSDDETETAALAGIVFHPLPPAPAEVVQWDDAAANALRQQSLEPLRSMAADYHRWSDRLGQLLLKQDEAQAPWAREIHHGLKLFALRAEHAAVVYETALALREALRANDLRGIEAAAQGVEQARALTALARTYVEAREADYRYPPALTIAGDEPGSSRALPNKTIYPYRYLSRTHRMFYWTRPDEQLAALFGEGRELVRLNERILPIGTPLAVSLLAPAVRSLRMDWGDGAVTSTLSPHSYTAQGRYAWTLDATTESGAVHHEDEVWLVERRFLFPKRSLKIEAPEGAALLEGLLPGLSVGLGDDGEPFWVLGRVDDGALAAKGTLLRRTRDGLTSGPADLTLELKNVGPATVYDAVLQVSADARLRLEGKLRTSEIVALLVSVGGFEPEGAREAVAEILGYTPRTLPELLPFTIGAQGREGPP